MEVKLGGKLTKRDTHEIEVNLVPPGDQPELRDGSLESS